MPIAVLLDLANDSSQAIKHRSEYPTANVVDGSVFFNSSFINMNSTRFTGLGLAAARWMGLIFYFSPCRELRRRTKGFSRLSRPLSIGRGFAELCGARVALLDYRFPDLNGYVGVESGVQIKTAGHRSLGVVVIRPVR